jgi:hypothetical protein
MDNKCYRCGTKNQCSQEYPALTSNPVNSKTQKFLNINTSNAINRDIQCCVQCISPKSRMVLHNKEVFIKPENMFLNYIVDKLDKIIETEKSFNKAEITQTNPNKKDKYDLLVENSKKYMLIEVDERQHFEKKKFHEDRAREKRFWNKYGHGHAVIRLRVGDETTYSCISRQGGKGGGCSVSNQRMFNQNMNSVIAHIKNYFNNQNVVKHGYIEFFNTNGVQDFKNTFSYIPSTNKQESSYTYTKFPNEVEKITNSMNNTKISNDSSPNPESKRITCMKSRCREITTSKTGFCKNHR